MGNLTLRFAPNGPPQVLWFCRELRGRRWEIEVIRFIERNLLAGQVFVDVGAWVGPYSIFAGELVGPSGKVYAFEPDAAARRSLEQNCRLNNIDNVEVSPLAISVSSAGATLSYPFSPKLQPIQCTSMSMLSVDPNAPGEKIPTISLDDFFAEIGVIPDMVKIDVEGHEEEVVEGGRRIISNPSVAIIIETHSDILRERAIDNDFLRKLDRKAMQLDRNHLVLTKG
jgi:FkbM family methyltransferase